MGYTFKFGTYDEDFNLVNSHQVNEASHNYIPSSSEDYITGNIRLVPWTLHHISSFNESIQSQSVATIGIPDKPAECAHVYDISGVVRQFSISGQRYDNEEDVSNIDFIFSQFCKHDTTRGRMMPFTGQQVSGETVYSIGVEWMTSTMQSTMRGYTFEILKDDDDSRLPGEAISIDSSLVGQKFNVGLSSFQFQYSPDVPGVINYSLTLVERFKYPNGPIYREYTSNLVKH